ncbi:hypothetical protein DFH06DRAFT_1418842 [Mycena polygramma]|nr:hypothetical protein DFH06DRAFT_1418842 [Mycena polygramma]
MLFTLFQHAVALLALSATVYSQSAPTFDPMQFSEVGTIDAMTLGSTTDPLSGGSITINGIPYTIPKNTLVTLPSITVAWSELFPGGQPNLPLFQTSGVSWEATVFGNTVAGQRIVGLLYIAQESFQLLQGFISSIDMAAGTFVVDGRKCLLNDPLGTYGKAYTANPLWSVDSDNPSIRASTGFPVCVPRSSTDPDCPLTNRPVDPVTKKYLTTFTCGIAGKLTANQADPTIMVPLAVGDYITYSGVKVAGGTLAIYSLEANLGIFTAPGTKPAYITVESANYAIRDLSNANLAIGETRAVAITTDPTVTVQWYAVDVNPCTGAETERKLLLAQGSSVAPIGKIDYRMGKTDAGAATREVRFRYSSGTSAGPKGLVAGEFTQPIFAYIFPEMTILGAAQVPLEFNLMPFLAQGSGLFQFGNTLTTQLTNPPIVGQLSPWPGSPAPAKAAACPAARRSEAEARAVDAVTINSATTRNTKGATLTTVIAQSSDPSAQLFMAITGVDNVSPQTMDPGPAAGQFALSVSTKGKPSSVTITSDVGGAASKAV